MNDLEDLKLTTGEIRYLKEIGKCLEEGKNVNLVTLSKLLGVKPPSTLEILIKLESKGLIKRKRREIELSEKGEKLVKILLTKKRIIENFFYFILKLDPLKATKEAEKIDCLIDTKVVLKMKNMLEKEGYKVDYCIHGKRIFCEVLKDLKDL